MGKLAALCILLFKLAAFCIVLFKLTEAFSAAHHHQHPFNANQPEGCLPEFQDASPEELSDPRSEKYTYTFRRNWDYDTMLRGPLFWNRLDPQCLNAGQSPINIKEYNVEYISKHCNIWPADAPTNFWLRNAMCDGHTITLKPPKETPMRIELYSSVFRLVDIHFHTPSEHRYLDEHYPLEAHFVMVNENVRKPAMLVRGIFFDVSDVATDESDFLAGFAPHLASVNNPGDKVFVSNIATKGIMQIFENACISGKVAHYDGSLTTPPCNGSISWQVLTQPQHVSVRTYNRLKRIMKFNSRYTQNYPSTNNILKKACSPVLPLPAKGGNVQMEDGGFEL